MLFPKNIKYKKVHRHKNNNLKKGYSNFLNFASFAIKALENMRLSSKLLNIILFKIQNVGKQVGKAWVLVFPNKSATRKKEKARMGKGVGVFFRWFCFIKTGQIIFEFESLNKLSASLALARVQKLVPIKLRLVNV